jgi:hypothetical protein
MKRKPELGLECLDIPRIQCRFATPAHDALAVDEDVEPAYD